jgi:hypothetical protein
MTRFYFHFARDGDEFEDAEGADLPDLAAARKQALDAVRDVKRSRFARYGPDWSGWSVRVSDEAGTDVLTVPFSEQDGA